MNTLSKTINEVPKENNKIEDDDDFERSETPPMSKLELEQESSNSV